MNYSRQEGWFEPSKFHIPVHVIGVGATGSFVALQLVKMGVKNLHIYDFDKVEEHNVANQVYSEAHIGMYKVDAFVDATKGMLENDQIITVHNMKVDGNTYLDGIVFVLTDTMASRKEIWKGCLRYKPQVKLVIETRMSINCGRVYAVDPMKVEQVTKYEKCFYEDTEAEVSLCGSSLSIVPTAVQIAGMAVWKLLKFHLNKPFYNEVLIDYENNNILNDSWK